MKIFLSSTVADLHEERSACRSELQAIGFDSSSERETVMTEMYSAAVNLVRRRLSK